MRGRFGRGKGSYSGDPAALLPFSRSLSPSQMLSLSLVPPRVRGAPRSRDILTITQRRVGACVLLVKTEMLRQKRSAWMSGRHWEAGSGISWRFGATLMIRGRCGCCCGSSMRRVTARISGWKALLASCETCAACTLYIR